MKSKTLNIIIIILSIIILGFVGYFVYDKSLINEEKNNSKDVSYNATDYVSLENVDLNYEANRVDIEKVVFKNIDVSIVNSFIDKQNELINSVKNSYNYWESVNFEGLSSSDGLIASSDIWYQVNGNILSVYYNMNYEDGIGKCNDIIATNIDLKNMKLVSDEELLKIGNSSFDKIAEEHYNKTLDTVKKCDEKDSLCAVQGKDYNLITVSQFTNNKDIYIDMIVDGLDDAISCYIKDGKIEYAHETFAIDNLYLGVGKGGCFNYVTVEVGEYK